MTRPRLCQAITAGVAAALAALPARAPSPRLGAAPRPRWQRLAVPGAAVNSTTAISNSTRTYTIDDAIMITMAASTAASGSPLVRRA